MKIANQIGIVVLSLGFATTTTTATVAERPNILLILCDDLGYADVGFNGSKDIRTPELDRLADHGTIFSSAYVVHPFCGPSRMGLMSGRYPHAYGAPFNLPNSGDGIEEYNRKGIPESETLLSTVLKNAGYFTGAIGKWHMGIREEFHPNTRGFDEFYGFLGGGHNYFPEQYKPAFERQRKAGVKYIDEYLLPLEHNGVEVDEKEYMTDAFSREAVRFVKTAAKRDQPFFLYLAYNAPHSPLQAKEEDLREYLDVKDKNRRIYAAMVHAVDRGVGNIVAALKKTTEFDNTLIVFLSDNGGKLSLGANNGPLREGKGSTYEGGYRVPMFFHWPNHIPGGKRFGYPVSALDFFPTFAGLGGAVIPEGKRLDGVNIRDGLLAERNPREEGMIYALRHRMGYSDVGGRRDRWKVARVGRNSWQLFDIEQDIGEQNDLSAEFPERVRSMVSEIEAWSRTHTEPRWFHIWEEGEQWRAADMPRYDETFHVD